MTDAAGTVVTVVVTVEVGGVAVTAMKLEQSDTLTELAGFVVVPVTARAQLSYWTAVTWCPSMIDTRTYCIANSPLEEIERIGNSDGTEAQNSEHCAWSQLHCANCEGRRASG